MVAPLYRGFSTVANQGLDTRLFEENLVRQDLINHFQTRLGERVGRPGFGSIIHDLLFDLIDDRTEGLVIADAERILSEDPRVEPLDVSVSIEPDQQRIELDITVRLVEFNMSDQFTVVFEER